MPVPVQLTKIFPSFPSIVVCGSRSAVPPCLPHFLSLARAAGVQCHTGCCAGVPAAARAHFGASPAIPARASRPRVVPAAPGLSVWVAGTWPRPAIGLAKRSQSMVSAAAAGGWLWCSFPASAQPAAARPARSWLPLRSGTWSSLCLAMGRGCSCLVFRPGWSPFPGFISLGAGWFFHHPSIIQLSFF